MGLLITKYSAKDNNKAIKDTPKGTFCISWSIINHPHIVPYGALDTPPPSHSANFKKRFNSIKVVIFGAMSFVMGRY